MYIINFQHFLDENGDIYIEGHIQATRLAFFVSLIVDEASLYDSDAVPAIRCNQKGCTGLVVTGVDIETEDIYWVCPKCKMEGRVSNWKNTKWDNCKNAL
jgi:hypothetical protein